MYLKEGFNVTCFQFDWDSPFISSNPLTPKSDNYLVSPHNNTPESHIIKENDCKLKTLLIVSQILLVITMGNAQKTVGRVCIPMFGT